MCVDNAGSVCTYVLWHEYININVLLAVTIWSFKVELVCSYTMSCEERNLDLQIKFGNIIADELMIR